MELPFKNDIINRLRRKCRSSCGICFLLIILGVIYFFEIIIIDLMKNFFLNYRKNCPFTITDDINFHYKRRCELYNINNNSRYLYQYICSYDPSKEFKKEYKNPENIISAYEEPIKLKEKIMPYHVRCIKVNKLIHNNTIIDAFNNEYQNIDKFYCCRTNKPEKNLLIKDNDCNNKVKYVFMYILYIFIFYKIILI